MRRGDGPIVVAAPPAAPAFLPRGLLRHDGRRTRTTDTTRRREIATLRGGERVETCGRPTQRTLAIILYEYCQTVNIWLDDQYSYIPLDRSVM